jgi:hypothetical protein
MSSSFLINANLHARLGDLTSPRCSLRANRTVSPSMTRNRMRKDVFSQVVMVPFLRVVLIGGCVPAIVIW